MSALFSLVLITCTLVLSAAKEFRFASYYGDHMVLQKAPAKANVWGFDPSGAEVVVSLSGPESIYYEKRVYVVNGKWFLTLNAMEPGGPYNLTASQSSGQSVMLTDVLFGDVWLCGGQSNMAFTVGQVYNSTQELSEAQKFPDVRIFQASLAQSAEELTDLARVEVPWSRPTAEILGGENFSHFSGVCWLFGRYLYETRKYPIGLVESCWSGTPVEAWSSERVLHQCGLKSRDHTRKQPYSSNELPVGSAVFASWNSSVLWNAMIHPFLNMSITGVIWYQGESNAGYHRDAYNCSFPAMIDDWRASFHQGSRNQTPHHFPFGFTQISTNDKDPRDGFREIRWHQTADYGFAPNPRMPDTFMAVTVDLPDEKSPWGSIHPRDKQDVAHRLVLGARAVAYGEKDVSFQGPFPTKVLPDKGVVYIVFSEDITVGGYNGEIEICCSEHKPCGSEDSWSSVSALEHDSNYINVSVASCSYGSASAVRYLWTDWPCAFKACLIYSSDRLLPAPPFIMNF